MTITHLKGGLGNQMFQYAHGRAVSLTKGDQLKLDLEGYKNQPSIDTPRQFALSPFNIQAEIATLEEIKAVRFPFGFVSKKIELLKKIYSKISGNYNIQTGDYLNGFWTNEKYFKDIRSNLLKDFSLKNQFGKEASEMRALISSASVSLHVRRGDYVTNTHAQKHHGVCGLDYYEKAIQKIATSLPAGKITFFVFSDDIAWTKENIGQVITTILTDRNEVVYVSRPNIADYEEIILMSLCSYHIIANSTFSWWGAWLGTAPDAMTIAPKQWTARNNRTTRNIIPPSWIKI